MVLNLDLSPRHDRNVNLTLNLQTLTVCPQFHVQYDDFYETEKEDETTSIINSLSRLAGFT